jgi:hypothetical protein
MWNWEDGRTVPTAPKLAQLAAANVDPLVTVDTDPTQPTLHDLRLRKGLTAKELAERAGLP